VVRLALDNRILPILAARAAPPEPQQDAQIVLDSLGTRQPLRGVFVIILREVADERTVRRVQYGDTGRLLTKLLASIPFNDAGVLRPGEVGVPTMALAAKPEIIPVRFAALGKIHSHFSLSTGRASLPSQYDGNP
jgi:hypothetical protein